MTSQPSHYNRPIGRILDSPKRPHAVNLDKPSLLTRSSFPDSNPNLVSTILTKNERCAKSFKWLGLLERLSGVSVMIATSKQVPNFSKPYKAKYSNHCAVTMTTLERNVSLAKTNLPSPANLNFNKFPEYSLLFIVRFYCIIL